MPFKSHDLLNKKFGRLLVVSINPSKKFRQTHWNCICDCGTSIIISSTKLTHRNQSSCGCLAREKTSTRNTSHGLRYIPEYRIWANVKSRCVDISNLDYGGRGIRMCDRWMNSFENFFADMGARPTTKHTIERDDVNGNYEPDNCRWATYREQFRNKTNNVWIEFNGWILIQSDWADILGISRSRLCSQMKKMCVNTFIHDNIVRKLKALR